MSLSRAESDHYYQPAGAGTRVGAGANGAATTGLDAKNPGGLAAVGVLVLGASGLLAAVALQQVHRVDGNRVAADAIAVFVVHDGLP